MKNERRRADGAPPTGSVLRSVVRLSTARPGLTLVVCLALAGAGLAYTATALRFQTSALALLPQDRLYVQRFNEQLRDFGELNDIVIAIEAERLEETKAYAARLAAELRRPPVQAARVTYRVDPEKFAGRRLLYASTDRLAALRAAVLEHRQFITGYAAQPTLARLVESVNDEIARRFASRFVDLGLGESAAVGTTFVEAFLTAVVGGLQHAASVSLPWRTLFAGDDGDEQAGYFVSADRQLLFVLVEPRRQAGSFTDNRELIGAVRDTIRTLRADYPGIAAGVTGTPALGNDEMLAAFHDSSIATALAVVLTLAAVLLLFGDVAKPLAMVAALMVSFAWSLGLITLTVGHLSVFSVMFISLLVGVGIDYGIYFLFRYKEEVARGSSVESALETTAASTGPGMLFGAATAAGTFGVLMLTEFRGVQEFGFIGAVALLMAFAAMMSFLPTLVCFIDGRRTHTGAPWLPANGARPGSPLLDRVAEWPRAIVMVAIVLTAASLWLLPGVGFDYNRLNLQATGTESVTWERKIMASGRSAFPALTSADSLDELRRKQDAFARLATVSDVVSIASVIPREQEDKLQIIRQIAPVVQPIQVKSATEPDLQELGAAVQSLRRWLALAIREAGGEDPAVGLKSAEAKAAALQQHIADGGRDLRRRLEEIQAEIRDGFVAELDRLQGDLATGPVMIDDVPDELRRAFVGRSGAFLMKIYPAIDTWSRDGGERFVSELRTIDPAVTGPPVISYEGSRLMEQAYFHATLYAFVLVTALAGVMLRRLGDTALAVTPLVLGTVWTIGWMHAFNRTFNLANVWALPLIIGAGAEYGLNIMLGYREATLHGGPILARSTAMAVMLSGLTTIAGFGSLMVARHEGIFGLGLLLCVGAVATLAASLLVLPALLHLVASRKVLGPPRRGVVLLLLPIACAVPQTAFAGIPTDQVHTAIDDLYRVLGGPRPAEAQRQERDAAARGILDRLFDWTAMARQSLHGHWDERTPAERAEFTRLFAELFRQAFVSRIHLVDADRFQYLGETTTGDRATVRTKVPTRRGSLIQVEYVVRLAEGQRWLVQDVRVEGISLIDSYRTQFHSIIERSSYEALLKKLRDRSPPAAGPP